MGINTDTMKATNDSLLSAAEALHFRRDLFAILPFILLCFLGESKLEPLTSAARLKKEEKEERERERGKKSFISCTSSLELHLELITPPSSLRVISDSDTAYTANWKTWQSRLCLKGTRELGSRSRRFLSMVRKVQPLEREINL